MMPLIVRIIDSNFHLGKMTRWQLAQNVIAPLLTLQTNFLAHLPDTKSMKLLSW